MNVNKDSYTDSQIRQFYNLKNIAVVGMSKNKEKPAYYVPEYLIQQGYHVIPVNPTAETILARKSYGLVSEIKEDIEIVNVFRKSEDVLPVVEDLVKKFGIKVIWLQKNIYNNDAQELAQDYNIAFVYNRCMMEEHQRLFKNQSLKLS